MGPNEFPNLSPTEMRVNSGSELRALHTLARLPGACGRGCGLTALGADLDAVEPARKSCRVEVGEGSGVGVGDQEVCPARVGEVGGGLEVVDAIGFSSVAEDERGSVRGDHVEHGLTGRPWAVPGKERWL